MRDKMARKNKHISVSYTEIIDLQTVAGKTSIIGFHTPIGINPVRRLRGLYASFRWVKYNGCKVTMVPAANLPVDPLGLTGVVGTTDLMDPRDALNPIITHGCHGEHLGRILDNIYTEGTTAFGVNGIDSVPMSFDSRSENSDSVNKIDFDNSTDSSLSRYYQCLTDVSWRKHGIQSPLTWRLRPLVNRVAMTNPLVPNNDFNFNGGLFQGYTNANSEGAIPTSVRTDGTNQDTVGEGTITRYASVMQDLIPHALQSSGSAVVSPYGVTNQIFTNGLTRMGWLPTTTMNQTATLKYVTMPKQFMGVMIMPPSYNIEQFFRLSIRHSYSFADFTTSLGGAEIEAPIVGSTTNSYFNWVDYDITSKETPYKYTEASSMDMIDASAEVIADGVR